ncbi:MAG: hypothetical protein SGJ13_02125 [Actinomycetota bacterium]|nr:hypothetical protein [Actinomycetota bacterium]
MSVLVGGGVIAVALAIGATATAQTREGETDEWDGVLEEARAQVETLAFSGTVVVEWHDRDGRHREELDVHAAGGVVEIDAERTLVGTDSEAMLDTGAAWTMLAKASATAQPELASSKYTITEASGPAWANRPTTMYEATNGATVVTRVYLDDETGVVLRRETLDADGQVTRAVWFTHFEEIAPRLASSSSTLPAASGAPTAVDDLDAPMQDPGEAGSGFHLVNRWLHGGDLAQLYYTDGVLSISVFEQSGSLDWDRLPASDDEVEVAGHDARRYALPVGDALVFERGGVVYTCVGDVPAAELLAVAADVSAPDDGAMDRFTRLVIEPFRW